MMSVCDQTFHCHIALLHTHTHAHTHTHTHASHIHFITCMSIIYAASIYFKCGVGLILPRDANIMEQNTHDSFGAGAVSGDCVGDGAVSDLSGACVGDGATA